MRFTSRVLTFFALQLACSNLQAAMPSPEDWRDQNIYFIFLDRFNDGDPSNNNVDPEQSYNPTGSRGIHGGDFRGVEDRLDYIKGLGATAIWITPIVKNVGSSSYHGYGAHDFTQVAPHWGSLQDLTNMVSAAHERGMYVILDVVCNHMGDRITSSDSGYPSYKASGYTLKWANAGNTYPAPFNSTAFFHNRGNIGNFVDPEQILGDLSGLDDLQTESSVVRSNLIQIYSNWIAVADFDGFRIDTVKHTDVGFWQAFNPAIRAAAALHNKTNFFQFGEVYDGSEFKCGYYTGTKAGGTFCQDAVLDYPLYFQVNSVFAKATGGTQPLESHYNNIGTYYDDAAQYRLVTFLDNHDQTRFMNSNNANNDTNRLQLALSWLYTARGIPCLYYGTEQNFNGSGDPNNREDMFAGRFEQGPSVGDNFNMTKATYLHLARLNNLRRNYPALCRGTHANLWNTSSGPGLFAYARRLSTQEVYVVLNTASGTQTVTNRPTIYPAGTALVNLLNTNETITTVNGVDGLPPVSVPGTSAKIFVAASQLKPLDPLVLGQSPAHAVSNVSPLATITVKFSKPMDMSATEGAFSTEPSVPGTIVWNADQDELSFLPASPGFPVAAVVNVTVGTNAVDAVSTNGLFSPFTTFFRVTTNALADLVPPSVVLDQPADGSVLSGLFMLSGTASDNLAVAQVEFQLDGGDWEPANGTTAWTYAFDSALFLNGSHTLSARAHDQIGNVSTTASVHVRFLNVPGEYEARISAGNTRDVTNCDGRVWVADRLYSFADFGYSAGTTGRLDHVITGICAQAQTLLQRERYSTTTGSFRYLFDGPPGVYETTLLEAETWNTTVGQRLFDLYIEDQRMLTNFDILAEAGAMDTTITLVFTNDVVDGQLEMLFVSYKDNARASGIQVRKIADVDSDHDGIWDWWTLAYFDHAAGQEADLSRALDDPDGDGLNNTEELILGTDPKTPSPLPLITAVSRNAGAEITVPTTSNRLYDLQSLMAFDAATAWTTIQQNVTGTGGMLNLSDTNDVDQQYYRVLIHLP